MTTLPAAVIFDWDNTLIDTFPVIFAGHNRAREAMGKPAWSEDEARANIRLAAKDAFPLWYNERAKEAEKIYADYVRANHLNTLEVFEHAKALLDFLKGAGVPMAIVSNKRREFLRAEVDGTGWTPYFTVIMGADDVSGPGKPSPEGILSAMQRMNLAEDDRKAAWYVGDTETDIKAAQAAGVIPVFIENTTMIDPGRIAALRPAFSFKNPEECLAHLKTLG